jgi:hypothetical protein
MEALKLLRYICLIFFQNLLFSILIDRNGNGLDVNEFCFYLLENHVAVIHVEMATDSIIQSKWDMKTSFETQLSNLGKQVLSLFPVSITFFHRLFLFPCSS